MITIRCRMGVHSGRTVESTVRRWYGNRAYVRWSADPNSPELGMIVKPVDKRRYPSDSTAVLVLDTLLSIEDSQ